MHKYRVIRDCWWMDTYWKKDQIVTFDDNMEPPKEHFEDLGPVKKPGSKKNENKK